MLETLSLRTLDLINNGEELVENFDRALKIMAKDCQFRPCLGAKRKLVLTITMEPRAEGTVLESIDITADAKYGLPPMESGTTNCEVKQDGSVVVNPASPDEVKQGTLNDAAQSAMQPTDIALIDVVDEPEEDADVAAAASVDEL